MFRWGYSFSRDDLEKEVESAPVYTRISESTVRNGSGTAWAPNVTKTILEEYYSEEEEDEDEDNVDFDLSGLDYDDD